MALKEPRWFEGTVMPGHGLASGIRGCQDIGGTIKAQRPFFEAAGVPMQSLYNGTINVDISPFSFIPVHPCKTVRQVKWDKSWPPEDFSFFHALFEHENRVYEGLVYLPHPETKPSAFLGHSMLELLLPFIKNIEYNQKVKCAIDLQEMAVSDKN